jgi:hypothetical protein
MKTNKGKSHGLILLLDCSGSMGQNMDGSIEQILILSMFCRKVKIPFRVFGFVNHSTTLKCDFGGKAPEGFFHLERNNLCAKIVQLREYLNSTCSNKDFNEALFNMTMLKKSYEGRSSVTSFLKPASENLSNTPLIEAMIAIRDVSLEFKKQNNLDIVNLAIVHDGDADSLSMYYDGNNYCGFSRYYANVVIQDKKFGFQVEMDRDHQLDDIVYKWFTQTTGFNIFGFFVTNSRSTVCSYFNAEDQHSKYEKFKSEKYAVTNKIGFKDFYLIRGGQNLVVEDEEFTVDGKITSSKLKNAFIKHNKKKYISRVLVSRFIEGIAV